ncbi:LysM peptidoglycan-binding domain-containing protein [Streptococcus suis]|uniref:LysM peptidoglycan-binding domain-containing protein n=1 Tax=Streptococcus suis TaxID=1307 RepID=UPI001ABDB7C9|nr:LysM peptidoglycan-binding domain-containing protein [Streptococcus suis]
MKSNLKNKHLKLLCSTALLTTLLSLGHVASADTWIANTPESIMITPGQTSYELKLGDTLWAISQKINASVEELAELNGINLLAGEEKRLSVGRKIVLPRANLEETTESPVNINLSTSNANVIVTISVLPVEEFSDYVESVEIVDGTTHIKLKDGKSMDDFVKDLEEVTKEIPKPVVPGTEETPLKPIIPSVPETPSDEKTTLPRKVNTVVVSGAVLNGRLVSDNSKVVLNQIVDFGQTKFQSFYKEKNKFYSLHDLATSPVTVYDSKGNIVDEIYKEATGHNNDVVVLGNQKYITPGGTKLYVWDTDTNAVSSINLDNVAQYGKDNNTRIDIGGIAQSTTDDNLLYLVGLDKYATSAEEREKGANIIVFTYDKTTGQQEFFLRDELDYIGLLQGATEHNGVLYLAQNTKTDNYNLSDYKGITIKAYDTATATHIDDVQIDGVMEAEGMQVVEREDGSSEIAFGLVNGSVKKVVSIEPIEPASIEETTNDESVDTEGQEESTVTVEEVKADDTLLATVGESVEESATPVSDVVISENSVEEVVSEDENTSAE